MCHGYELIGSFAKEVSHWAIYQGVYISNSKLLFFPQIPKNFFLILLEGKLYLITEIIRMN